MANNMSGEGTVLLHATAVDFYDSTGQLYGSGVPTAMEVDPSAPHVADAIAQREEIIGLKLGRESVSRAIDISGVEQLTEHRASTAMSLALLDVVAADARDAGLTTAMHGLADVPHLGRRDLNPLYSGTYNGQPIHIRAEEGLTPQAAEIAHTVHDLAQAGAVPGLSIGPERTLVREARDGNTGSTNLYGYTFRHGPDRPGESRRFADFPACPPFIAATVLEQTALADSVLRIVPSTFKNNEQGARSILRAFGYSDLPVVSVGITDEGDINKIISWSTKHDEVDVLRGLLQRHMAHRNSSAAAHRLHNQIHHVHRERYDASAAGSSDDTLAPGEYLGQPAETRVETFLQQGVPAAPLFERTRVHGRGASGMVEQLAQVAAALGEAGFGVSDAAPEISLVPGLGSNAVAESRLTIATMEDPINSDHDIQVVAHMVHENATDSSLRDIAGAANNMQRFAGLITDRTPAYLLVEAVRQPKAQNS
jgi:hypothetical protein